MHLSAKVGTKVGGWLAMATLLGAGLVAFSSSEGCTVTTGTDDGGFGDDAATADTAVPLNACNECTYGQCSPLNSVCFSNADCISIYQCAINTGDGTTCYKAGTPSGQVAYLALATCDLQAECSVCTSACANVPHDCSQLDAGTTPDAAPVEDAAQPVDSAAPDAAPEVDSAVPDAAVPATCDQCVADHCSAEKAACAQPSECATYTQCVQACTDIPCIGKCGDDHAAGKTASTALGTCTTTNCTAACGLTIH